MKKVVKWILIALAVAASAVGTVYYMQLPITVSGVVVEPKTAELYFTERGIADVDGTVSVYATVPGRIESLNVLEKQLVKAGDVICVVDTTDLKFQIAQTESSLKGYQAQIANLDIEEARTKDSLIANKNSLLGELKALEAQENSSGATVEEQLKIKEEQIRLQNIVIAQIERDLERAREDLDRADILRNAGALPDNDYKESAEAVRALENMLAQSEQQLQIIESGDIQSSEDYYAGTKESLLAQIAGIDETLNKSYTEAMKRYYNSLIEVSVNTIEQLKHRISESSVTAPVGGVITTLNIKDTNMVNAQTPVAIITTDDTCNIEAYVATNDIDDIYVGQKVDLILKRRNGDKILEGEVKEIADKAEVRLSALGVEERRVKVTVEALTGVEEIKEGFDVDVKFTVYREENKLTAPKTAFFIVDDNDTLWLAKDGKAIMTKVTKGMELRTEYIVESGLSQGDIVITDADAAGLKEGVNVKIE